MTVDEILQECSADLIRGGAAGGEEVLGGFLTVRQAVWICYGELTCDKEKGPHEAIAGRGEAGPKTK
jgi:hypothetical protein